MPNTNVNKVQVVRNGTPEVLIDLTSDTVTPATLLSGYTAHDASGAIITGTATSGGTGGVTQDAQGYIVLDDDGGSTPAPSGGLVYETGTFEPTEDTASPTIYFSDTHATRPFYVLLYDANGTLPNPSDNSNIFWLISSHYDLFSVPAYSSGSPNYARVQQYYRTTSNSASASSVTSLSGAVSASYLDYWLTNEYFSPRSSATSRYWRAGTTYKWIAVWAPTA